MKGIVFTEFLELVCRKYGPEMMDFIIESARLPSGAAYTATGTYDHREMVSLVKTLSVATRVPVAELFKAYGEHLFDRFAVRYPQFFAGITSSFEFLDRVEQQVRKLHPEAELPSIEVHWLSDTRIHLAYSSTRPLARFAEGLMRGAVAYFEEQVGIREIDATEDDTFILFELVKS